MSAALVRNEQNGSWAPRLVRLGMSAVLALTIGGQALGQQYANQSTRRSGFGSGFGQEPLPSGGYVEPRLGFAIQYADNINLEEDGGDSAAGIELAPGLYASYSSGRLTGAVDYSLIGRLWDDEDLNDLSHQLAANGRWVAVPDLFYIDADATYADAIVDTGRGLNYGNLGVFNAGNLAEQAAASIRPTLRRRFKDVEFEASYSYGRVWYFDEGKGTDPLPVFGEFGTDDSEDQTARVSFGLAPDAHKLDARVFYDWEHSEFERSIPYEFERAGIEAGYELTAKLSLVGDYGEESDLDESTTDGGLESEFWSAGFRWSPDSRTEAEARYGERFFGESYSVSARHATRLFELTASYEESPQVQTRQMSLESFEPGNLPPGHDPSVDFGRFNASPFVGKDTRLGISAKGLKTTLSLDGYYSERKYVNDLFGDEEASGVTFIGSRRLAANVSLDLEAWYTDTMREASLDILEPIPATHDYDTQVVLRANRESGANLVLSLESGYFNRSGSTNYDGWWVGLRGTWIPSFSR